MTEPIPNTSDCCNLRARNWRTDQARGTALKGLLQIFLASSRTMPLNTSNMETKGSALILDMCTGVTALHITYLSLQSLRQCSLRYQSTVRSWTAEHRAETDLKVQHFCMICMIAFTWICFLSNILSICTFIFPHHRILKIKFTYWERTPLWDILLNW